MTANNKAAAAELLQQEAAFQRMADEDGVAAAYKAFLDPEDGRHLRVGVPISNALEAWKYYGGDRPGVTGIPGLFSSHITEVWASKAGDWGVTLGRWRVAPPGSPAPPAEGSFTNTWRKDDQGQWKIIVNTGILDGPMAPTPNSARPAG